MNKRIISGLMVFVMLLGGVSVCLAEDTVPTSGEIVMDVFDDVNLDPAKGPLTINGLLLINAEGSRAESLEEAVNVPAGFFESQAYLDYLNPPAPEKEIQSSFPDVPSDHAFVVAIEDMKKNGYIVGFDDGTFRPESNVTRAEFVKVLIEKDGGIANVPDGTLTGFSDVDTYPPHWAQKYIALGVQKGYLAGMGDGTFAPNDTIKYEQAMKILVCHFGKEVAAKTISNPNLPLWPNAYVVTGEQMNVHVGTGLSLGKTVNRGQFSQMLYNGIKEMNSNVIPFVPSGGSVGGGTTGGSGGGDDDEDAQRLTGVIVSTEGILIDPNTTVITNPVYIMVRYTDKETGEPAYIKLREPYDRTNPAGKNMYKNYLGHEVSLKYKDEGEYFEIVSGSLKSTTNNKEMVISAEDIDRARTLASAESEDLVFFYSDENSRVKEIKLPDNLDNMAVVYNGVTIDERHPSYDHNFASDDAYIKIEDLLPQNGKVTFVNRNGGDVELAIVETYETLVPKAAPPMGVVTDKYDETKKFNLDKTRLLSELNTHYGDNRVLTESDIDITIQKKNSSGALVTAELYDIKTKTALTVYASKDRTKVKVYISDRKAGGNSGTAVTSEFNSNDNTVKLKNVKYTVSDYLIDNVENSRYEEIENMDDIFPLGETVVAYQDIFDEIVDVTIKDPDYVYGYLVDVDYEQKNTAENSYLEFRIITKDNVSKYADPENQTFKVKVGGKIKINDAEYRFDSFESAAETLEASARIINYGAVGSGNSKPSEVLIHATYAQPIRFVKGSANGEIKIIKTMVPTLGYSASSVWENYTLKSAYQIQDPTNTNKKYQVGTNAVIFSVPDDRFDYDKYEVKTRSYLTASKRCNPEVYSETTSTGLIAYNCVVLYDEGITGRPSVESPITIIKSIVPSEEIIDGDKIYYKITAYQPTSATSAPSEKTLYVSEDERVAVNTGERYGTGDVIVYGTTKIGTRSVIKNVHHIVDISDRTNAGFSKKYERSGEESVDETPYYWYRYGTVVDFDKDFDVLDIDVGEDEIVCLENTGVFFSPTNSTSVTKPVYFYVNGTKGDVAKGVTERFSEHNLAEMVQPGDMLFMFASGSPCYQKVVYLIPSIDRDIVHPGDSLELTEATVTFNVATEGAKVILDGVEVSVSDGVAIFENVREGVYTYKVTAPNHAEQEGNIIIRHNELTKTVNNPEGNPFELERYTNGARFNITPGNATVTIDGVGSRTGTEGEENRATIDFPGLEIGVEYNYTVSADGYVSESGSFILASERLADAFETNIELSPVLYEITFNITGLDSTPLNCTLLIDGEEIDVVGGSVTIQLASGNYSYEIIAESYEMVQDDVDVSGNETVNCTLSLQTVE